MLRESSHAARNLDDIAASIPKSSISNLALQIARALSQRAASTEGILGLCFYFV